MNLPDFNYEKRLWDKGLTLVAGADEVGRGCFAGPVVAGVVVFDRMLNAKAQMLNEINNKIIINDSKKLNTGQRELAAEWIIRNAITYGVGVGSVARINRFGITSASNFAFRSAFKNAQNNFGKRIQYLLIDAFYIPYIRGLRIPRKSGRKRIYSDNGQISQLAIVKGDTKSISISASSIIAKVYRDKLMEKLGVQYKYKKYGWDKNKGYGTKFHQEAIVRYGITGYHRKQFVETFLKTKLTSKHIAGNILHS